MVYWGTKQPSQVIFVCHNDLLVVCRPLELFAIMQAFSYSSVFSLTSPTICDVHDRCLHRHDNLILIFLFPQLDLWYIPYKLQSRSQTCLGTGQTRKGVASEIRTRQSAW